ncbi:hypothetical protein LCGC14_2555740 [marine sediment metagenome]|uniref:Uncharacterized protein n=1 Tax=marine sediment metagenome TaxID=412755 RepID=A0A0F9AM30_9ZZZZ
MSINARLIAPGSNKELHYHENPVSGEPTLVIMTLSQAHGQFKSATLTSADTSIIVQPRPGLSIAVTDILVSGEKQATSDVTVQLTDGADTVIMFIANQSDIPPTVNVNLTSYFYGWKDARVEMITSGIADATVTIGYFHSSRSLTFAEWDGLR